MYGYSLLWADNATEALEVFKLMVAEFPNSSNTYDSLGEAYLAVGDEEQSLVNYKRSLEMDPDNFNAEDQIQRMLHPDDPPQTDEEKFDKVYSVAEYRADMDQMAARLLKVHPNALKFITEDEFWSLIEKKKSEIKETTTYAEFMWHCEEIIASLNCAHTSMGRFSLNSKMLPKANRFPVQTRLVGEQLFVVDAAGNEGKLAVRDEIVRINGVAVAEVLKEIYRRIPSQGYIETTKRQEFNIWGSSMIAYALGFPEAYEVIVKGSETPVVLNGETEEQTRLSHPPVLPCENLLCFELLEDKRSAILTIASFNYYPWNDLDVFISFLDHAIEEIEANGVEHLIIDLRNNGGGSSESSVYLLRYLMNAPFTYLSRAEFAGKQEKTEYEFAQQPFDKTYGGKLYFLIDGIGNSTTGHFMSVVKTGNLGTVIGEELGSNQFCSAGQMVCRLSNTKLMYYVANNTFVTTATSLPDERGILPDHYVTQSIDDYLNEVDAVKEFAIGLTKE
jgi:tetratricopeptide (TPR) repeat protein